MFNKLLPSITRIYRHEQYHIQILQDIFQQGNRRMRIQCNSRLHSRLFDRRHRTVQMCTSLIMHIHHISARSRHFRNELLRFHDHQMYIHRFLANWLQRFQNRKTKRYIRNEHTVHYIQMQPISITLVDHFHFPLQVQKISS